jgi:GTP pyrophosphokinase
VGAGHITGRQVIETVFPGTKKRKLSLYERMVPLARGRAKKLASKNAAVPIKGLIPGMAVHFAGCCHPLPGDRIVGVVTTGKGVTIHTIDCEGLEAFADSPERWIDVSWEVDDEAPAGHVGRIQLSVINEPGSLGSLTTVIAKNTGNITNLKITNRTSEFFDMLIDIEVRDVKHLTNIIAALRATPSVNSIERART